MPFEERVVEGLKVTLHEKCFGNPGYVVYDDKIWVLWGKEGFGRNLKYYLERPVAKEKICLKTVDERKRVRFIIEPKAFIKV